MNEWIPDGKEPKPIDTEWLFQNDWERLMSLLAMKEELSNRKAPEPPKYQLRAMELSATISQSFPMEGVNIITNDFKFEDRYVAKLVYKFFSKMILLRI